MIKFDSKRIFDSLYPKEQSFIRKEEKYFLLFCAYNKFDDILQITYKNTETNEKVTDFIHSPLVPVFETKYKMTKYQEYIPHEDVNRHLISYKNKTQELRSLLFGRGKFRKYYDKKANKMVQMYVYPDMPDKTELLHPNIYFADVSIEEIVRMEYALIHYGENSGVNFEQITYPKTLDIASFDIETTELDVITDDNGNRTYIKAEENSINLNTFVDKKTMTAYAYYVRDSRFKNQQELEVENINDIIRSIIKEELTKMMDVSFDRAKPIIEKYINELKIIIKGYDTEKELIVASSNLMFTHNTPDVLMAFNAPFDVSTFNKRIIKNNLPIGTWNKRGIGMDNTKPYSEQHRIKLYKSQEYDWTPDGYVGSSRKPAQRKIELQNISDTLIMDSQHVYYGIRKAKTFSSVNLDDTLNREMGITKHDFSDITNSILRLPFEDFLIHVIYGLIDSIHLLVMDDFLGDISNVLILLTASKVPLKDFTVSNIAITRSFHTSAIYAGLIPGNNINKIIRHMTNKDLENCSKHIGLDLVNIKKYNFNDRRIKGGIVSNPCKYLADFVKTFGVYNILDNEVVLTNFKKALWVAYLDFKSFYPNAYIARNISKDTLLGAICSIVIDNDIIAIRRDYPYKGTLNKEYPPKIYEHFGKVNMAVASNDIITYANICNDLPSIDELINYFENGKTNLVRIDENKIQTNSDIIESIEIKNNKLVKLFSVLCELNKISLSKTEETDVNKDTGCFLIESGQLSYYRTLVEYNYKGNSIKKLLNVDGEIDYVTSKKGFLINMDIVKNVAVEKCDDEYVVNDDILTTDEVEEKIVNYEFDDMSSGKGNFNKQINLDDLNIEWKELSDEIIDKIYRANDTSLDLFLDDVHLIIIDKILYFPFKSYFKKSKDVNINDVCYRTYKRKSTSVVEFKYNIFMKDIVDLDITQQLFVVNM